MNKIGVALLVILFGTDLYAAEICANHAECSRYNQVGIACGNGGTCSKDANGCWKCVGGALVGPDIPAVRVCNLLDCTVEEDDKVWTKRDSVLYQKPTSCAWIENSTKDDCIKVLDYEYACESGYFLNQPKQGFSTVSCTRCPSGVTGIGPRSGDIKFDDSTYINNSKSVTSCYLPYDDGKTYTDTTGSFVVSESGCYHQ